MNSNIVTTHKLRQQKHFFFQAAEKTFAALSSDVQDFNVICLSYFVQVVNFAARKFCL